MAQKKHSPPNRPATEGPPAYKPLTGAERRDQVFGVPCRLWQLVVWYVSTDQRPKGRVFRINELWSLFVNRSESRVSAAPDGHGPPTCGAGDALAFRTVDGLGTLPALSIKRNGAWSLTDGTALEAELSALLEDELRARKKARALVRYRPRVRRLDSQEPTP